MTQPTMEDLQRLSDEIQEAETSICIEEMARLLLKEKKTDTDDSHQKWAAPLLLRSMRIHLCLDLLRQGHSGCVKDIRTDWQEIINILQSMKPRLMASGGLLSVAADLILLLDPARRRELLHLLDFSTRLKIKKTKPLHFEVPYCALLMVRSCLQMDRTDEMFRICTNLISLSQERHASFRHQHRYVVSETLYYTVDNDPSLTARICGEQQKYYDGIADAYACKFYWYYGFSTLKSGRWDEAVPLLKRCHDLCLEVEGETSWIGVRAGYIHYINLLLTEGSPEAEAWLWDALEKVESGFYKNMDASADIVAAEIRASVLKHRLDRQDLRGLLPEIQRYRAACIAVEETNRSPLLTVRRAENMLAGYYIESGDYLLAADHAQKALQSVPPNGVPADPSDVLICSNLLQIYTALNDHEQIRFYAQKLEEMSADCEDDDYVQARVALMKNTAAKRFEFPPDGLEEERRCLQEFYDDITHYELEPYPSDIENVTYALYTMDLCASVLDSCTADPEELNRIREIVDYFTDRPGVYRFNRVQKCTTQVLRTLIQWQLGSPRALGHLEQALGYIDSIDESREARISILRFAAYVYHNYRRPDLAGAMLEKVFSGISAAWQKATAYLNDHRICQLLTFIQIQFDLCYALLRATTGPEALYGRLLQYKDLPALVGRERNRLLRMAPVDEALKKQIFDMQDRLAAAELDDSRQGTSRAQDIAARLERLEAEFARQFPRHLDFTDISYARVCEKLPEGAAIAEYFFTPNETVLSGVPQTEDNLDLDIFIITKRNGVPRLEYLRIPRGDTILWQADRFIDILQDPGDAAAAGEKATLRGQLYRSLIEPVLPFLEGITDLYLAPDNLLCNLPFEILYSGGSGILQDRFRVCRLVCGRDLLFHDDRMSAGGGSFILGDPNYESDRGERSSSHTRGAQMELGPVDPLPFSGIEAARISRRCRTTACSGDAATKYALADALPCRIIHLATHGMFDEKMEAESLYASHLVFAGYNKWVSSGTESSFCGNGILTADEISRMDLGNTELVVLSACQSGLGDTSYGSIRGLLPAFSAAGARWIISHMWEAYDLSTPILMDAFYDAWLNRGYEIPDALQYAKHYLKTVTIGMLRRDGWLDTPQDPRIDRALMEELRSYPADCRPFEDEFYWGGFTVHKSR